MYVPFFGAPDKTQRKEGGAKSPISYFLLAAVINKIKKLKPIKKDAISPSLSLSLSLSLYVNNTNIYI
jgi:hypothetical protein